MIDLLSTPTTLSPHLASGFASLATLPVTGTIRPLTRRLQPLVNQSSRAGRLPPRLTDSLIGQPKRNQL